MAYWPIIESRISSEQTDFFVLHQQSHIFLHSPTQWNCSQHDQLLAYLVVLHLAKHLGNLAAGAKVCLSAITLVLIVDVYAVPGWRNGSTSVL